MTTNVVMRFLDQVKPFTNSSTTRLMRACMGARAYRIASHQCTEHLLLILQAGRAEQRGMQIVFQSRPDRAAPLIP